MSFILLTCLHMFLFLSCTCEIAFLGCDSESGGIVLVVLFVSVTHVQVSIKEAAVSFRITHVYGRNPGTRSTLQNLILLTADVSRPCSLDKSGPPSGRGIVRFHFRFAGRVRR